MYNELQEKIPICQYLINQANANRQNISLYHSALGFCEVNIWYPIIAKTIPADYSYFVPDVYIKILYILFNFTKKMYLFIF